MELRIIPINADKFVIRSKVVNVIYGAEYMNTFSAYQRAFKVFGFMDLQEDLTYKIIKFNATSFTWRKFSACSSSPSGSVRMTKDEISPCRIESAIEYCAELGPCFGVYEKFVNGTRQMDGAFNVVLYEALKAIGSAQRNSLVQTLVLGGFHEWALGTNFAPGNSDMPAEDIAAFTATHNLCTGILRNIADNVPVCTTIDATIDNCGATYEVVKVYDDLACCIRNGKSKLKPLFLSGYKAPGMETPMFIIDVHSYSALVKQYNAQALVPLSGTPMRISRRVLPEWGDVLFIDNTPVVPFDVFSDYDVMLVRPGEENPITTLVAILTTSENMQIGHSYGTNPYMEQNIGMTLYRHPSAFKDNQYEAKTVSLVGTAIADTDSLAWAYAIV